MRGGRTEERGGRAVEQGEVPAPSSRGRGAEERGGERGGERGEEEEEEGTEDRGQRGLAEDIIGGGGTVEQTGGTRGQLRDTAADAGHATSYSHRTHKIEGAILILQTSRSLRSNSYIAFPRAKERDK